jgi:hypothetical protein
MRPPPAPSTLAMQCGSATSRVCDAAFRTWRAQPSAVCLCAPPGHCAAGEPRALWVLAERCSRGGVCRARAAGARPACLIAQGRGPRGRSAPRRARWQRRWLSAAGGGRPRLSSATRGLVALSGNSAGAPRDAWASERRSTARDCACERRAARQGHTDLGSSAASRLLTR